MNSRIRLLGLVVAVGLWLGGDLLACGDKFLIGGRGTRYQRPKNARAASVLIYADPASGLPAVLRDVKVESILKQEGHKSTTVETLEQLRAILASGRFDVILAGSSVASSVEKLVGSVPGRAVVVPLDAPPKDRSLLKAIDKAVERHDQNARKLQNSRS